MVEKNKKSAKIEKTTSVRGLEDTYTPAAGFGIDKAIFTKEPGINVETLYDVIKKSPEAMAPFQAIMEDIMADGWRFDTETKKKGPKDLEEFLLKSDFYKVLSNAIFDLMITGNAYILKLSVNEDSLKSLLKVITGEMATKLNVSFEREIMKKNKKGVMEKKTEAISKEKVFELVQTDFEIPQDLQLLKSSTMRINFDETGEVSSYQQKVGIGERVYGAEDIIHLSLVNVGGQPYGLSPLEVTLSDIATLIFAKEYAGKYFENDGIPNFLFKMPDDGPDSPNVKRLKQELRELKKKENKFRSLVVTGNVDTDQLQKFGKDLEYAKLIQHFTQIILIASGVPTYRINYTLADKQAGSEVNRAFEGYYKRISWLQKILENTFNRDLFSAWKAKWVFKRAYKIDEIREATKVQILTQAQLITVEEAREMMGLAPEMPKGTMPKATGDDNRFDFNADRRATSGQDNNPPAPDQDQNNQIKIAKRFDNLVEIEFPEFLTIVERLVGEGNFQNAKIVYEENNEFFILYFNDLTWVYRSIIDKDSVDVEKFRVERLTHAVKLRF